MDLDIFLQNGWDNNNEILDFIDSNPNIKNEVNEIIQDMGEKVFNIKTTMHSLCAVGKYLEIADLGSESHSYNVEVKGCIYLNN